MPTPSPSYDPNRDVVAPSMSLAKQQPSSDSVDKDQDAVGSEPDFGPISIAEAEARGGWTNITTGAPGLAPPSPVKSGCGHGRQGYGTGEPG